MTDDVIHLNRSNPKLLIKNIFFYKLIYFIEKNNITH